MCEHAVSAVGDRKAAATTVGAKPGLPDGTASFANVGVWHGPPNVLVAPKPTSSSRTKRMFGAPAGAFTGCGKSAFESFARRLMVPRNGWGGLGSTSPPAGGWLAAFSWPGGRIGYHCSDR